MNFMFPVPDASVPAREICSLRSAAGIITSAREHWKREGVIRGIGELVPDWLITSHVTKITSSDWLFTYPVVREEHHFQSILHHRIVVNHVGHMAYQGYCLFSCVVSWRCLREMGRGGTSREVQTA